jgi:epoxyqueuosine reductase
MKISSQTVKDFARRLGADVVGIGDIGRYDGTEPGRDPRMIFPGARSVVGVGIRIPRGTIRVMAAGRQYYGYTSIGTKLINEDFFVSLLLRMARVLEDAGFEACLQRTCPNVVAGDDPGTNPEVAECVRLSGSTSVDGRKPAPDVLIDFAQSAVICGMGSLGFRGNVLTPEFGPFQRLGFIITDAPLKADEVLSQSLCDQCGECVDACPGRAISREARSIAVCGRTFACGTFDPWQCSVYYRGAHRKNPYLTEDFLKDDPERELILDGKKRFDENSAKRIYPQLSFLPTTQYGYVPCLCGKACDVACYSHLQERGIVPQRRGERSHG